MKNYSINAKEDMPEWQLAAKNKGYFEEVFKKHFGMIKEKAFKVEIEFTGWAAIFVAERIWSPDQKITKKGKNKIILEFTASSEPELINLLLSFGEEAKVIKPESLIKKITDIAKAIIDNYQK